MWAAENRDHCDPRCHVSVIIVSTIACIQVACTRGSTTDPDFAVLSLVPFIRIFYICATRRNMSVKSNFIDTIF